MLSLSADLSKADVDLQVINGDGDGGVQFGRELREFAEALASRDEGALATAREALYQTAGNDVLIDAAGVAANFQRMVRIADATGIPVDDIMSGLSGSIPDDLNLRRFQSAGNTPEQGRLGRVKGKILGILARRLLRRAASG